MAEHEVPTATGNRYLEPVPIGRSHGRIAPQPFLEAKAPFEGMWVAVHNGKVVAAEHSSRELVFRLQKMGPSVSDAVIEYVRPASDGYIVGVG